MTEQFIIEYIPKRIAQLGFCKYHIKYVDMVVQPGSVVVLPAYNELFFIVNDPSEIIVESSYGIYDSYTNPSLEINQHEHRGEIVITNPAPTSSKIKFIQVIIVN